VLIEGIRRVRGIAAETMDMVYEAMGLYGPQLSKSYSLPLSSVPVPPLTYC